MNRYTFNEAAWRVQKAAAAAKLSLGGATAMGILAALCIIAGLALMLARLHLGLSLTGAGTLVMTLSLWIKRDLHHLPPAAVGTTLKLDELLPPELVSRYRPVMTAAQLWTLLEHTTEGRFMLVRFELPPTPASEATADWQLDHAALWAEAEQIAATTEQSQLTSAIIMCAFFKLCPGLTALMTQAKVSLEDLEEGARWLGRLSSYRAAKRPNYGGVARDWAAGFTPLLSRYGANLSREVEFAGRHFGDGGRSGQLDALVTGLNNGGGSVVLVGEPGIGKTELLRELADRLLRGEASGSLARHQIISLDASTILSSTAGQGDLERIVLGLFNEATHAGNIVIALDDAQLFFGQGPGAVNLNQILLPVLQSRSLKLVLAVSPGDWQRLKATGSSMTSLLTPLVLQEPVETEVIRLEADQAVTFEQGKFITTYQALKEAYRLSGRYFDDEAYPGRAFKLLEAAYNYPDGQFITEISVQQAIESQFGVKVQTATATETDVLLHLEDHIHERMINQSRAVSVVASALRRARAGVSNPKRPIGSFLFLGPTGVGKTELARSLAALYFGSEGAMIRLDMSEYQQTIDVDRILLSAADNPTGLLPQVRQQPFSVVLFDEIEKAHPNILNLFLQLLDEGNLTDTAGHATSFKDAIIIATSNAGADEIREHIEAGGELESFEEQFTNDLISSGAFKPELLNRFDEIVLFRPLNQAELGQVVHLLISEVNRTLQPQKITVALTEAAIARLVQTGYDPRLGARPMRRMVTRRVEDAVAGMILQGQAKAGDTITLDATQVSQSQPEAPSPPA